MKHVHGAARWKPEPRCAGCGHRVMREGIPPRQTRELPPRPGQAAPDPGQDGEASAVNLLCPSCPQRFEVSEEDPDATLSDLWAHLGHHARNRDERMRLFAEAREFAR